MLAEFIESHSRVFVLTGAGCSTDSGIADYRDSTGAWKRAQPVSLQAFMQDLPTRRRYWARSLVGWKRFRQAQPNDAHRALVQLERAGRVELLVTQNVDGLHRLAGSTAAIDLHGRLDQVQCTDCADLTSRTHLQQRLIDLNPEWNLLQGQDLPDGDADLNGLDFSAFLIPECERCGGVLKPDVVFFGETVPQQRVALAMRGLERADAMLVVGSSLMVYSGYRFVRLAAQTHKPIAAVNIGRTRADELLTFKVRESCCQALKFLLPKARSSATPVGAQA